MCQTSVRAKLLYPGRQRKDDSMRVLLARYILKIILMTYCFLFDLDCSQNCFLSITLLVFWIQGTMTSSSSGHSSDDRWYELLEPPPDSRDSPPPLPARLSAFQPINEFKVGEKVTTCLLKAERSHELRRQLERSPHDYHLLTRMPKVSRHEQICSGPFNILFSTVLVAFWL